MSADPDWAAGDDEQLADGWEPGADDTLLRGYVDGFAAMVGELATRTGGRVQRDDVVLLADAGSPAPYLNGAIVLRPLAADEVDSVMERAVRFFTGAPGGPWILFSPLPLPSLRHHGLAPGRSSPVHDPGGGRAAARATARSRGHRRAGRVRPRADGGRAARLLPDARAGGTTSGIGAPRGAAR